MKNKHKPKGIYEKCFKRPIDFCCGMAAILVFWWLYIIIAILVKVKLGSPVLFVQERPGKDEKIFKLYKFRTMTNARDEYGELLPDEERLTKFGRFLRSTSMDEIPEAFNLINGTLSFCGPRPLLVSYLPYYSDAEHHRHDVRPGLTGLAQVNGRNSVAWDERFQIDLKYVNNITFRQDLEILCKTVLKVVKRADIATSAGYVETNFAEERKAQLAAEPMNNR